jgi:hypothetical protein
MSENKDKQLTTAKVTLARARELLGNTTLSDAELEKVLENLRHYCTIVYEVTKKLKQNYIEIQYKKEENTQNNEVNTDKKHNIKDAA